jgi:hypothetical protein
MIKIIKTIFGRSHIYLNVFIDISSTIINMMGFYCKKYGITFRVFLTDFDCHQFDNDKAKNYD